jgi:hypothetical protein
MTGGSGVSDRASKRDRFEKRERSHGGGRSAGRSEGHGGGSSLFAAIAIGVLVIAGAAMLLRANGLLGGNPPAAGGGGNRTIRMTDIELASAGGELSVPVAAIRDKGLVRFVYKGQKDEIPLLAYVAPSGKLVAAVSMCEPCASTRFTIQGNRIVCNACGSVWDLETLKGISGGCLKYPPDRLESIERDGKLVIAESVVAAWKPRV